jgi:uracil phosphoribosyltransferase
MHKNLHIVNHPLVKHKLGILRNKETSMQEFRALAKELSVILVYESMKNWNDLKNVEIETPITKTTVQKINNPPVAISILRAGNPVLESVLEFMPFLKAGHIGMQRNRTTQSIDEYYFKLPTEAKGKTILLCEPMLATADTSIAAILKLKEYGVGPIKMLTFLVSEAGVNKVLSKFPDVEIYALNLESSLNEKNYLVPGLGDAGDRIYGTLDH